MVLRTNDSPDANGRVPQPDDVRWSITLPLENGESLTVFMGKQGRDILFGMLVAEDTDDEREARDAH